MGSEISCCFRGRSKESEIKEKDIIPDSLILFKSLLDSGVEKFDFEFNFLSEIEIDLFLEFLSKIRDSKNSIIDNNPEIDETRFSIFVDKKLILNILIKEKINYIDENDPTVNKYRRFLINMYVILITHLMSFRKRINEPYENLNKLSKLQIFIIGFTFCNSMNKNKLNILFRIFSENQKIKLSKNIREFIFLLFVMNSKAYLIFMEDLFGSDVFTDDEKSNMRSVYNNDNIFKFTDHILSKIFDDDSELTEKEFINALSKNIWICYGQGIRYKLEEFKKI